MPLGHHCEEAAVVTCFDCYEFIDHVAEKVTQLVELQLFSLEVLFAGKEQQLSRTLFLLGLQIGWIDCWMRFRASDPDVCGIIKLDQTCFILEEFNLHPHDFDPVNDLQIISDFITGFQAVHAWIQMHQSSIISSELFEVIMDVTLKPSHQSFQHSVFFRNSSAYFLSALSFSGIFKFLVVDHL